MLSKLALPVTSPQLPKLCNFRHKNALILALQLAILMPSAIADLLTSFLSAAFSLSLPQAVVRQLCQAVSRQLTCLSACCGMDLWLWEVRGRVPPGMGAVTMVIPVMCRFLWAEDGAEQ